MKLFLFQQGDEHIASRELLRLAVRQYEAKRIQTADNGEFLLDSPSSFRETEKTGTDLDSHSANTPSLRILEAPGGKPFLADERGQMRRPFFSVTHTGSWWLCAVAEHPLGIDMERKCRHIYPSVARRICTPQEMRWLKQEVQRTEPDAAQRLRLAAEEAGWQAARYVDASEQQKLLWLWVRKEAYVKYLGTGIAHGLHRVDVLADKGFRIMLIDDLCKIDPVPEMDDACQTEPVHKTGDMHMRAMGMEELLVAVYCPQAEEAMEGLEWLQTERG